MKLASVLEANRFIIVIRQRKHDLGIQSGTGAGKTEPDTEINMMAAGYSVNKCLLSTYCVPTIVLGSGDIAEDKVDQIALLIEVTFNRKGRE